MRLLLRSVPVLVGLCVGCFYDSRWGQQKKEQRHEAARLRPQRLEHAQSRPRQADRRVGRVRAYATRAYIAETLEWEKRFDGLLRDASRILESELGIVLESAGTSLWQPTHREDQMADVLEELSQFDPGTDAEWVVGFVESTPKLVVDFHQLGVARTFSKHLVVRASNDPKELDYITEGLGKIGEKEQNRLYSERKHHRMVTVFLHEVAHTLGAIHRLEEVSIMAPVYDPKTREFDAPTLGFLRITVPGHFEPEARPLPYDSLIAYLDVHTDGWVEADFAARRQWLEAAAVAVRGVEKETPEPAPPAAPLGPQGLDALSGDDKARYEHAVESESQGDVATAWDTAAPLFETYPRVGPVQELRCRLAKAKRLHSLVVDVHCAPLRELGGVAGGS